LTELALYDPQAPGSARVDAGRGERAWRSLREVRVELD
jgi:hypothetical protein